MSKRQEQIFNAAITLLAGAMSGEEGSVTTYGRLMSVDSDYIKAAIKVAKITAKEVANDKEI